MTEVAGEGGAPLAARRAGPGSCQSVIRIHGTDLCCEDTGGTGEPILFLHGFLFDVRQYEAPPLSREMYSLITGSRLAELPGVGHSAPVEDPGGVTRAMEQFLDQVKAHSPTAADVQGGR